MKRYSFARSIMGIIFGIFLNKFQKSMCMKFLWITLCDLTRPHFLRFFPPFSFELLRCRPNRVPIEMIFKKVYCSVVLHEQNAVEPFHYLCLFLFIFINLFSCYLFVLFVGVSLFFLDISHLFVYFCSTICLDHSPVLWIHGHHAGTVDAMGRNAALPIQPSETKALHGMWHVKCGLPHVFPRSVPSQKLSRPGSCEEKGISQGVLVRP